ncbi:MAG: MBL fold metallo-hydrolase, partial [Candidatus Omnitrophota bacterium]
SGVFSSAYEVKSKILPLEDGGIVQAPGLQLKVLHIPGHTAGGIALLLIQPEKNIVFTGDSLFCGSIGRTDLAGGSEALLIKGIKEKLFSLPDETIVYPGHGDSSTIGAEKRDNPFLA